MTIILADGDFPTHAIPLQILEEAERIYCCDGAIYKLMRWLNEGHGIKAECIYVVGDGDSRGLQYDTSRCPVPVHLHHESEQDYNDLTKSMRLATSHGAKDVTILGATGLREDHTLGNISLLAYYVTHGFGLERLRMVSDFGTFTPITETTTFDSFERQQVSIFSLRSEVDITTSGLQYALNRQPLRQWWEGTLNAALGNHFSIQPHGEAEIIIYQTHEAKD